MLKKVFRIKRLQRGASLAFMAALASLLGVIAVASVWLIGLLVGGRELQNAADSGNLNVARLAVNQIGTPLQPGVEQDNFAAYVNSNGQVDLAQFNKIVGKCIWVSLNAEAENSETARQNAQALIAAAEGPDNSIGKRLQAALSDASKSNTMFTGPAGNNPLGMLKSSPVQFSANSCLAVGYMNPGGNGLTNITLDPDNLPLDENPAATQNGEQPHIKLPTNLLSSTKGASGFPFVNGYKAMAFNKNGMNATIGGVAVQPGQPPHLVANSDLEARKQQPVDGVVLPPNSFQSAAAAGSNNVGGINMVSSSIVGLLNQQSQASIPHGYIKVVNGTGDQDSSPLPSIESIFNNQLFTGIFVANNGAFSTDESLIQAWADFNSTGGQQPPLSELFKVNGSPASLADAQAITQLGGGAYPAMCDYTNVQGPNVNPAAAALLPAFKTAYPSPMTDGNGGGELTAVEKLKAEVMELYNAQGGTPATPNPTGMRYFSHTATYVTPAGGSPRFSRPGNLVELCNQAVQVENSASLASNNPVVSRLKQRLKEMKPAATDAEMNELLTGNTLELGQTFYIWVDGTNTFRMTQSAPQWGAVTQGTAATPDGTPVTFSVSFPTIGKSIDPVGECGFNQTLFAIQPNSTTDYRGVDAAIWTPSTGVNNLLGTLQFKETISGSAIVWHKNPPPPPCSSNPGWLANVENYIHTQMWTNGTFAQDVMRLGQGHITSVSATAGAVADATDEATNGTPAGTYMPDWFTIHLTTDGSNCGNPGPFDVPN